jgi:phospholipid/cholesterol/gamma-HCH transport system ATP-binding protein
MIKVENAYKSFNNNLVLNDVSVAFKTGKINLVIGQSGSGKTVLIKAMVGLHNLDRGSIFYDDINLCKANKYEREDLRRQIGMLFQGAALFDSMSVEENVKFPLDMHTKFSEEEKMEKVYSSLKRVNLEDANKKLPSELSGGMQKRVGIARAIVLNPKYLFCDEPTSGLDPRTAVLIDKLIEEITDEFGITTIINTHDLNSVSEIGEKIIYIHEGQNWWEGNKRNVFSSDNKELRDFVFSSSLARGARL